MEPQPVSSAATCASHPENRAVFVCRRCGTFACEACRAEAAIGLCRACAGRAEAALGAPITVGDTLARAFKLPLEHKAASLLFLAIVLAPEVVWALVGDWLAPGLSTEGIVQSFIKSPSHDFATAREVLEGLAPSLRAAGIARFVCFAFDVLAAGALVTTFVAAIEGRQVSLRTTYAMSLRRLLSLVVANGLVRLGSLVGLLFCILPGLAFSAAGIFVELQVIQARRGPFSAVAASLRMCFKALAPVAVLVAILLLGGMVLGMPLGALRGMVKEFPIVVRAVDVFGKAVGFLFAVPVMAGGAYLFARVEAAARLVAAERAAVP